MSSSSQDPLTKSYAVLEFSDGVAVVSTTWIDKTAETYNCWWPNQPSTKAKKMAREKAIVDKSSWKLHHNIRVLTSANTWERIIEKERNAQDTSSLDTEDELGAKRRKRVPKRFQKPSSSEEVSSEEEEEEEALSIPPPPPPLPPLPHLLPETPRRSAVMPSPVSAKSDDHNKGFQMTVFKVLAKQSSHIKDVQKKVEHNTELLQQLINGREPNDSFAMETGEEEKCGLPLSTPDELEALEKKLEDKEFSGKLVSHLSLLGGRNLATITKSILSYLFMDKLAMQYNWTGQKEKKQFKGLRMVNKIILAAVWKNRKTADVTKDEVKTCIVKFLTNARDRDGGRNKRRTSAELDEQDEQ